MKTMLMTVLVTLAVAGQASAAGKFAASEAVNKALAPISKGLTVESVRQARADINDLMTKIDSLQGKEREEAGAKLKKQMEALVDSNPKVVEALAGRFNVGSADISAFSKVAPELLLIEGWLRTVDVKDAATAKVVAELSIIIQKVAPLAASKGNKTELYAVYKALALVTTDIGGNYEAFRTELAAQLNNGKNEGLKSALTAAAKKVLGANATEKDVDNFLAELARCKV